MLFMELQIGGNYPSLNKDLVLIKKLKNILNFLCTVLCNYIVMKHTVLCIAVTHAYCGVYMIMIDAYCFLIMLTKLHLGWFKKHRAASISLSNVSQSSTN